MTDLSADSSEAPLARGGVLTQTWALLIDAYRELNARKLFWITLVLSVLVAGAFFLVSINETGIKVMGWTLPGPVNSRLIEPGEFFKSLFASFAVPLWLGSFASILALISVGSIFPDLLSGGAIDLYLSKPIGRLRLFLTKYVLGLMFVALQVAAFTFVSYLVIGIRGGVWEAKVFLSVPIVTLYFSYLYCVCVLIGVITRSALAAILVTVLLWAGLWIINKADDAITLYKNAAAVRVDERQRTIDFNLDIIARNNALPPDQRADYSKSFEYQLPRQIAARDEAAASLKTLTAWQNGFHLGKTFLPKTAETETLLSRAIVDARPQDIPRNRPARADRRRGDDAGFDVDDPDEVNRRTALELRSRNVGWVIGTSVVFEAVILAGAAWVFCRRDY